MEKPEGREWPSLLGEGSGASPSSHRQRQGPSGLLVGVGCSVSHHLGTQEVKPKVGRGGVTALGPGSLLAPGSAKPSLLPESRAVLCTDRRHLARGDPLKPSLT